MTGRGKKGKRAFVLINVRLNASELKRLQKQLEGDENDFKKKRLIAWRIGVR